MNTPLTRRQALFGTAAIAALPGLARAQAWPARPVTLIVPFPAGGGTDAFARPMAVQFAKLTGKSLVIDNRGGAGGTVGASAAAKAPPDGYTLFMGGGHHTIAPSIYPRLDYDLEKDFIPLIQVAAAPQVLVVNAKRANTGSYQEFLDLIRKNPGKLNYASAGAGSVHHLAGELFKIQTKTFITHIPYRGAGPALADLIAGNVDMDFDGLGSSAGHIKAGRIKALMVAGSKRNPAIPDVPCAAEVGLPDYNVQSWYGIWAPRGTPAEAVARATEDVRRACLEPEAKAVWAGQGAEFPDLAGERFAALIHSEIQRWAQVVKVSGVKLD
ncbi:MAG: tripartite tricarboxylate transporter substrate binding protein [Ottowia sp.]|uniref:Bug family tripartite tricarboxylate transporter substrate binding protein n=1 Tax=Ottowia sp. TaxID=1898956 RepID=UPI0039E429E2